MTSSAGPTSTSADCPKTPLTRTSCNCAAGQSLLTPFLPPVHRRLPVSRSLAPEAENKCRAAIPCGNHGLPSSLSSSLASKLRPPYTCTSLHSSVSLSACVHRSCFLPVRETVIATSCHILSHSCPFSLLSARRSLSLRRTRTYRADPGILTYSYGTIISTKAILDKNTNKCKGEPWNPACPALCPSCYQSDHLIRRCHYHTHEYDRENKDEMRK